MTITCRYGLKIWFLITRDQRRNDFDQRDGFVVTCDVLQW
jgi:hypothetical protein